MAAERLATWATAALLLMVQPGHAQQSYAPFKADPNRAVTTGTLEKLTANPKVQLQSVSGSATQAVPRPVGRASSRPTAPTSVKANPRIIGGAPVDFSKHPWQVALIWAIGPEPVRQQFCGGSLIAPGWVLTAAHCVDNGRQASEVDIVAGTGFYKFGGKRVSLKQILVHPQWNSSTMENDVALLKLATNVAGVGTITPLGAVAVLPVNTSLNVTGWGATVEGQQGAEILMGADMPIVDTATCNEPNSYGGQIKDGMFCAGLRAGGVDSCQGDSGGPATVMLNGARRLAGVVSWGEGCARALKYGVYTHLPTFAGWIRDTRRSNP